MLLFVLNDHIVHNVISFKAARMTSISAHFAWKRISSWFLLWFHDQHLKLGLFRYTTTGRTLLWKKEIEKLFGTQIRQLEISREKIKAQWMLWLYATWFADLFRQHFDFWSFLLLVSDADNGEIEQNASINSKVWSDWSVAKQNIYIWSVYNIFFVCR